MPLSKEDASRALSILEGILCELGECVSGVEEVEPLVALQATVDTMRSPLFSALIEIQGHYYKTVEDSLEWQEAGEVRLSEKPELVAQFCQRYGIPGSSENGLDARGKSPSPDDIMEEVLSPSSITPEISDADSDMRQPSTAPTAREREREREGDRRSGRSQSSEGSVASGNSSTPLVESTLLQRSREVTPSENRTDSSTAISPSGASAAVGKGRRRGGKGKPGKQHGGGGVSLAHLARSVPAGEGLQLTSLFMEGRGDRRGSTESSLSSVSSESSQQAALVSPSSSKNKAGGVVREEGAGESGEDVRPQPKDLLFFMRDKRSYSEIQEAGESGEDVRPQPKDLLFFMRDQRSYSEIQEALHSRSTHKVTLTQGPSDRGLGVELVGLSSTGVFVSGGSSDLLNTGDQILEVNGQSTENMADFEVEHLLRTIEEGKEVTLMVQYNPTGLVEYKRVHKR